ncbi:hypothetical protein C0992_012224 [Termitomyces sp. T32_za158]|nr:hypothetical protein C0992_012224 [Termitomyces sp. T32_za158]
MAPQDSLLRSICHSDETYDEAQTILRTAKQRTGPLSGYSLGPLIAGLPAVCAYIASTNLNNTDVTRKNAQIASCLKESDFNKVLETVKAAFDDCPRRTRSVRDVYDTLAKKYPLPSGHHLLNEWTSAVQRTLMQSDDGFGSNNSGGPDLKSTIFFWIYTTVTGKNPTSQRDFAAEHCTSAKSFSSLLHKINDCCTSLKNRIKNDVMVQRSPAKASATSTPRRIPKRPPRVLPSRDSPSKRKVANTPARLDSDDELDAFISDTPSKKRRPESPNKPTLPSPIKLAFPIASSSRVTLDGTHRSSTHALPGLELDGEAMTVDEEEANVVPSQETFEEDNDVEPQIRRRYRSVYTDHKQWYAVDRRVKHIRKQAERYKLSRSELHVHPFQI